MSAPSRDFPSRWPAASRCWPAILLIVTTVMTVVVAGCSTMSENPESSQAAAAAPQPEPQAAGRGDFTIAASMLDTWNAVGQLLVRTDGVTYEGRAQMLGLYSVRYRGERLLILTRAQVLDPKAPAMATRVGAARLDGSPSGSDASVDLLRTLQRTLPDELARIASGGR